MSEKLKLRLMVGEILPRDLAASSSVCQSLVCIHGPRLLMVDSGHGEQACWIFETEYYYEFQLSLLPTYLPFPSPRMLLLHTNTSTLYE